MITLELLTEYTHHRLRYKKSVKPFDFKDYGDFIHIFFDSMGESVPFSKRAKRGLHQIPKKDYYEWLGKRRESKIDNVLG